MIVRSFTKPVDRSHNYNEKIKAIKSNTFQHPYNIKESLGETLGDIVINLIPKHELEQMEENETVPLHFEVTAKNVLSNNIKLTPADTGDKTMELYFNTIMRKYYVLNVVFNKC